MTNTYLLIANDEAMVIDPAFEPEEILAILSKNNRELKYIINTHGHIDHTQADFVLKERTGAKIFIHELDLPLIAQPNSFSGLIGESTPIFTPDVLLRGGERIPIGRFNLEVIHTPGHTAGSISLKEEDFIFTGDTLFVDSIGRTDLPGGSEKQIFASLKKLSAILKDETIIYPGHGAVAKFKTVKRQNPFLT